MRGSTTPRILPGRRLLIPLPKLISMIAGVIAYLMALHFADRSLTGRAQAQFRWAAAVVTVCGYFGGLHYLVDDKKRAMDITKALIAIAAAGAVFYEQHREGMKRPVAERWKRFIGLTLGIVAVSAYFEGWNFSYPRFYHRHDQFHYYMGAKYFPEMGYDGLYKCTAIAQDEIGVVSFKNEDEIGTGRGRLDMKAEVNHDDWKIRNLGGDNLLMPVHDVLAHPETCKSHFSPERWEAYKADVKFFRIASDKEYWKTMQNDHGYNPPPVWTIAGYYLSNLHPATTRFLQFLGAIDMALLGGMLVALYWAFGWRVCAVGMVFWGSQATADSSWTLGAFLRQDWLFFFVLAACLTRKRWHMAAGASFVYAALLRIFPGLAVFGWLVVAGAHLVKHKTLSKAQWKTLAGGVLAAAVLLPLSVHVSGKDSYQQFAKHTLEVHDRTPLTNHMGLRVLIGQKLPFEIPFLHIGNTPHSGRVKWVVPRDGLTLSQIKEQLPDEVKDDKLDDPFSIFMKMRNERYAKYKPVAYGIAALTLVFFAMVVRRIRSLWIAQCLGQIFIILMSQLTNYYYSFMILLAPLTKARRQMEVPLFGFAALTQFTAMIFGWLDDKYWMLTALSLAFCYVAICFFRRPKATPEETEAAEPAA